MTNQAGRWSFVLPTYASLPAAARQAAATNHGYLNVTAQSFANAVYVGRQFTVAASGMTAGWVGTADRTAPAPSVAPVASTPVTMTVEPEGRPAAQSAVERAETDDYAAVREPRLAADGRLTGDPRYVEAGVPTNRFGYQINDGGDAYDPNMTTSGVDLIDARYSAVTPDDNPNPCTVVGNTTVNNSWKYTVFGEHHAGTDSSGTFTYTIGASSQVGTYYSGDAKDFSFNGYENYSSGGSTANVINPPGRNGHQTVQALRYIEVRHTTHCLHTGNSYSDTIQENGLYNPGNNFVTFKDGIDVSSNDSQASYDHYLSVHPNWVNVIPANAGFTITRNTAFTYGAAASWLGVGIKAESTQTSAVSQGYKAGGTTISHHVWEIQGLLLRTPRLPTPIPARETAARA